MKNQFRGSLISFIFLLSIGSAFAVDKSRGCGPANYIAPKNTMISTSTRATTEFYLFPLNWSATSSGTSGCTKHEIVKKQEKSYYFIVNNFEDLKQEIAIGRGEYLATFTSTLGCKKHDKTTVIRKLKTNYMKILPSSETTSENFFENIFNVLESDSYLSGSCQNVVSKV